MEAFEQFVAIAMEQEGLVVGGAQRFRMRRRTRKAAHEEWQEHGYEVDLVGARRDRLVLATVKSHFGSAGVAATHVDGSNPNRKLTARYVLLNDIEVRSAIVAQAAARHGYAEADVELRLYVGRFSPGHEARVRDWCRNQLAGAGPIRVVGAAEVVEVVRPLAEESAYRDSPVLATLKLLSATGSLRTLA